MNGNAVIDSNIIMYLFNGQILPDLFRAELSGAVQFVSVITRMELLAFPAITPEQEQQYNSFLSTRFIIPLDDEIERAAILLRRRKPGIKLPDAIIAATAQVLDAAFVTNDKPLIENLQNVLPQLNIISL
jgi:predicted nucleic acid-binding protein